MRSGPAYVEGAGGVITTAPGYDRTVAGTAAAKSAAERTAASNVELAPAPASPGVPDGFNRKTAEAYSSTAGTEIAQPGGNRIKHARELRTELDWHV